MENTKISAQPRNKKIWIAVYCRMGTKSEAQEDSLEMQRETCISPIRPCSAWEQDAKEEETEE